MGLYRIFRVVDAAEVFAGKEVGEVIFTETPEEAVARTPPGHMCLELLTVQEGHARAVEVEARRRYARERAEKEIAERKEEEEAQRKAEVDRQRWAEKREEADRQRAEERRAALEALKRDPCVPPIFDGFEGREDLYEQWNGAEYCLEGNDVLFAQYDRLGGYEGEAFAVWIRDGGLYEASCSHDSCRGLDDFTPEETSVEAILMRPVVDPRLCKILSRLGDALGLVKAERVSSLAEAYRVLHDEDYSAADS